MARVQRPTEPVAITMHDRVAFALVAPAMVAWWLFCRLRGKLAPVCPLHRVLLNAVCPPARGTLKSPWHDAGRCFRARVPRRLLSDQDLGSALELFEDGRPLGPGGAPHERIRREGGGLYSHWGSSVYFSSSDGSDPRTNGRRYTYRERRR